MARGKGSHLEVISGYMAIAEDDPVSIIEKWGATVAFDMGQSDKLKNHVLQKPVDVQKFLSGCSFTTEYWPRETAIELHKWGYDTTQKRSEYRAKTRKTRLMLVTRSLREIYDGSKNQMSPRNELPDEEEEAIARPFFAQDILGVDKDDIDSYELTFVTIIDPGQHFPEFRTPEEETMIQKELSQDDEKFDPPQRVEDALREFGKPLEEEEDLIFLDEGSDSQ